MTKVVVNGCFDVFHMGHLRLLQYAKSYPQSYVLVLIDSDRRVKELKGASRPINTEYERASLLSALRFVDRVEIFDSDQELINYIKEFDPDVMVKGSDYQGKPILGAEYCKQIKFYDRYKNFSSTGKIQDIADRRQL
jgi:D-beta-D-heptose 7-phosphate kinase/D-beta-D-heptose 1-phosphate adenosyltransferase